MGTVILELVAIAALAILTLGRGRDDLSSAGKCAVWLRRAGLAVLAAYAGLFLLFGVGEMASGDWSGAGHLISVLIVVVLAILAARRLLLGGVVLLVLGISAAWRVAGPDLAGNPGRLMTVALLGGPQILGGVCLLAAGLLARRATTAAG